MNARTRRARAILRERRRGCYRYQDGMDIIGRGISVLTGYEVFLLQRYAVSGGASPVNSDGRTGEPPADDVSRETSPGVGFHMRQVPHRYQPRMAGCCAVCGADEDDRDASCEHDPARACTECPPIHTRKT